MSFSKGGKRTTEKHTDNTAIDATTQAYQEEIRNAARQAGAQGPSPLVTGAAGFNTGLQTAGTAGINALSGDPAAVARLMNPYQQNVIDANNANWQHTNAQTMAQINDAATKAGAFGGSRAAIAQGAALAANNRAQQAETAGLLSSGYGQAINQANQLAGYGYAGAQSNANLGLGGVGSPQQWYMNLLKQGYISPYGASSQGGSSTATVDASGGFKIPFFGK